MVCVAMSYENTIDFLWFIERCAAKSACEVAGKKLVVATINKITLPRATRS